MELVWWQIIIGIIGTSGLSGLLATWVQRERVRIEAKNATSQRWKELSDGLVRRIDAQERLIHRQETRIESLGETVARQDTRIETQDRIIQLQQQEISALHKENAALKKELAHERRMRRQLEKRIKEEVDDE